ncbi:MAG: amino acid adenylation domain-containing protein, partial [Syntrophothermus sp.]
SYKELNEESNRLARYLLQKGVHEEDFVGLYMDRSLEMIIGILGILKAGAAYVPLDPNYPAERINYILLDAKIKYLVTKELLLDNLISVPEEVICLDRDKENISLSKPGNPAMNAFFENAAYVIYTSGSTGKPKGVVVTHLGTCNLLQSMKRGWEVDDGSRMMQFASISFDASLPEIFLPLISGAQLFIAPREVVTSVEKISDFIAAHGINLVTLPPSVLTLLPEGSIPPEVTVVSAGEECSWDNAGRYSKRKKFINAYGPTEVTVCCSWNEYNPSDSSSLQLTFSAATFPVGKPFQNVRIYILDRFMRPVLPGIKGEIFVSGPGLARGYLGRPDLTAEKFIPDPYSLEEGRRLYKTGDMARYLPDGNIEYLGRNDTQVKIRGFRIELHEIESALMCLNGIENAVVLAKESKSGEKYLSAYLRGRSGKYYTNHEIREILSRKLPDYMLPSCYSFLEAFPITSNGKIDRHELLKLPAENIIPEERQKPINQLEELLKIIWAEVLDLPDVDIESNFFDLGGHSLKAARIISRIRKVTGETISLRTLFNNPTVSLLADAIRKEKNAGIKNYHDMQIEKSKKRNNNLKEFEMSFSQQRLWFLEEMSPGEGIFNLPLALRLVGELNFEALRASLSEIIKRHESLRTVFISVNEQPFQVVREVENIDLRLLDLSYLGKSEAELELKSVAAGELRKSFLISGEFSFRFILVKIAEGENVLLTIWHHIITDGWSMTVFIQEMIHYYKLFTGQNVMPLPELPLQYADYAEWQRNCFTAEVAREQIQYWKDELEGIKPLLELPTDFPRPKVQTFNGAAEKFTISRMLEQKLRAFCQKESVTPYIALLSVFQILLARLCDS